MEHFIGKLKKDITKEEALSVAKNYMADNLMVTSIDSVFKVDKRHEYRKKRLPAYVISYDNDEALKA